jgi:hypothetical protein
VADEPKKSDDNKPSKRRPENPSAVVEIRTSLQSMQDSGALDRMRRTFSAEPAPLKDAVRGSEPSSEKTAMADPVSTHDRPSGHEILPKNWIEAIPAILFGFYGLAFAFEAVSAMNRGDIDITIADTVGCAVCAGLALAWWKRKDWLPQKLVATSTAIVTDARWILGAMSVLLIASVLAPYIEQRRLPFAWQFGAATQTVIHDPPSADDIANVTRPIQDQLNAVTQQRDAALSEAASLRRQLEDTKRPQAQNPAASQEKYALDAGTMRVLLPQIIALKPSLPKIMITRSWDMSAQGAILGYAAFFQRMGIEADQEIQEPAGSDQQGVMLAVVDVQNPPPIALQLADIMRKAGFGMHIVPLIGPAARRANFSIYVGPAPL